MSALQSALVDMDFAQVSDLFFENATGAPSVLWGPSVYDLKHPVIKNFAACIMGDSKRASCIKLSDFKKLQLQAFQPWLMLLEPVKNCTDFKYLKYGSEIAVMFGRDMTDHFTSEIGGHVSDFFIALYAAAITRKECVMSIHDPPADVFATSWRRLIVPLLDETGDVALIAALNIPDNELRAGMEVLPDPAMIVQTDGQLMFSNSPARRIFGELDTPGVQLSDYCNIDIELPQNAEDYATSKTFTISHIVGTKNQLLVYFEMRISATYFKGRPYFVVLLKPT